MSWSAASLSVVRVIRNKVVIASGVASPPRALAPLSERAAICGVEGLPSVAGCGSDFKLAVSKEYCRH